MDIDTFVRNYWKHVVAQDEKDLCVFFNADASIRWHCTNEQFTVQEFIRANCEYPGSWHGEVERVEAFGDTVVTATRVWAEDMSFHVCSFFKLSDGKIVSLDEYWGDDGPAPAWRQTMQIGRPISRCSTRTGKKPAPSRPPL